jgi:SAM-dependent methyltransferase
MLEQFRFGENWKSFLSTVTPASIAEAELGMSRLFPNGELRGRKFFDIGCGSGLSMLAAYRLGAARVDGIDIDPDSVEATRSLLSAQVPADKWSARPANVLDLAADGSHDIVHSWGVLHHTGALWNAMTRAVDQVAEGGYLAVALYRRTPLCQFWTIEKRFYYRAPALVQMAIKLLYKGVYLLGVLATGRNPLRYIAEYQSSRGMDWHHDVHDWLGGFPYESTDPPTVCAFLNRAGFSVERAIEHPAPIFGLFGSHCDEFVARRTSAVRQ